MHLGAMNNEKDTSAPDAYAQAMAFMAETANGDSIEWDEFHDRVTALPDPVARVVAGLKYKYDRLKFEDELAGKALGPETRIASPSGKYSIGVSIYEGANASRGVVYQKEGDGWRQLDFEVKRNYGAFPFLFIEGHATGHDFVLCGEDYQCSMVLELDTGRRRDYVPFEEVFGWGFCWAGFEYHAESQMLIVDGCLWACPYEFRFYDFSDPMEKGWPHIEVFENGEARAVDADAKSPLIEGTRVTTYETADPDEGQSERVLLASWTFERMDNKLVLQNEWVSEREQQKREKSAEAKRVYKEWEATFKTTDPLYVLLTERSKDWPGSRDSWSFSVGVVHDSWCPTYKSPGQKERRVGRRVINVKKKLEARIEWGVDTGPIRADVTVNGEPRPPRWFMEHSTTAMAEALDYVETWIWPPVTLSSHPSG